EPFVSTVRQQGGHQVCEEGAQDRQQQSQTVNHPRALQESKAQDEPGNLSEEPAPHEKYRVQDAAVALFGGDAADFFAEENDNQDFQHRGAPESIGSRTEWLRSSR